MNDDTNTFIERTSQGATQSETKPVKQEKRDWVGSLIIPITLVFATALFSVSQLIISNHDSDQQHIRDTQLAQNQQHGEILVNYQKDISDLLLNRQLGKSNEGDEIRVVAQAKTLAALSALDQDGQRKGLIIQFLYEAQLIQSRHPIIDLNHAELSEAKLSGAHLRNVNLSEANMRGVDLSSADLSGAYLEGVVLENNNVNGQDPVVTNLSKTDLSGAYLWNAILSGVDLSETKLSGADLSGAKLCGTMLGKADLEKTEARLTGTYIQSGTTMPTCQANPSVEHHCGGDLEDDSTQWTNIPITDKPVVTTSMSNVAHPNNVLNPNIDGNALQISFPGGTTNAGIQAYQNLPLDYSAQAFELCLSFYITERTPIQALAFSMQRWDNNQEWQWALQWQLIGDGSLQQGTPPNWRIWTGKGGWQDTKIPLDPKKDLTEGKWHTFDLQGGIFDRQVQYKSFTYDATPHYLSQSFDPVPNSVDKLAVAIQLDADSHKDPYDVYIDGLMFTWSRD